MSISSPVFAAERLDIETAVTAALAHNERAAAADARHDAAEARADRARAFFFPDLTLSGGYTRRAYETVRTVDNERLTIADRNALLGTASLSLALFDARSLPLYAQAARDAKAAGFQSADDRRRIAFEATDAFLAALGTEQVLSAAERRLEFARSSFQDAQTRFDAGLVSSNDVTRVELEVASAERVLAVARAQVEMTFLELGNLLDVAVEPPLVVPDALLEAATAPSPATTPPWIAAAQERRLDVAAARERAAALHAGAREPLLRYIPRLGFAAQARITNEQGFGGRDHDWSLGVDLTWPLYDGGERHAERRERRALARAADLGHVALRRQVEMETRRARAAHAASQAAMLAAVAAVAAARKNAGETTELYRQGLARALEVADASVRLFESEVALAGERFGLGRAYLNLRAAQGLDPLGREP